MITQQGTVHDCEAPFCPEYATIVIEGHGVVLHVCFRHVKWATDEVKPKD